MEESEREGLWDSVWEEVIGVLLLLLCIAGLRSPTLSWWTRKHSRYGFSMATVGAYVILILIIIKPSLSPPLWC